MNNKTDFTAFETIMNLSERGDKPVWLIGKDGFFVVKKHISYNSAMIYEKVSNIQNPHLPLIYTVEEIDGSFYVFEQYIKGKTLRELLEYGCFSEEDSKHIIIQLCDALEALHDINIIHRDVKPENIILNDGKVFLIDFGVSRIYCGGQDSDTEYLGTAKYASPEQFGFEETDEKSDIYSLGKVFYELLTGRVENKINYPGEIGKIIDKCCRIDSHQRYPTIRHLKDHLLGIEKKEKVRLSRKISNTEYVNRIFCTILQFWAIEAPVVALIQSFHNSKSVLIHGFDFFTQAIRKYIENTEFNGLFNIAGKIPFSVWALLATVSVIIFVCASLLKNNSAVSAVGLIIIFIYDFRLQLSAYLNNHSLYQTGFPPMWTDALNTVIHITVTAFLIKILFDIPRLKKMRKTLKGYN